MARGSDRREKGEKSLRGMVKVKGHIGISHEAAQEVEFLVDTGSGYTVLPPRLANELGIQPTHTTSAVVADSRTVEMGVAAAYLKLMDREGIVLVGVLAVPVPLLGVMSLETLGLKVDPINETLEHDWPFGPAVL
jgi:clan AA aspartic protease